MKGSNSSHLYMLPYKEIEFADAVKLGSLV